LSPHNIFLLCKKQGLDFVSYESSAEGIVELVEMQYIFSEITIKPKIIVESDKDIEVAENLLEISKKVVLYQIP